MTVVLESKSRLFVVMGVCGCGKSSIGNALANRLEGTYIEGDALHPPANIELMSAGTPLTDADRWPWLEAIAIDMASHHGLVFASCSALRKAYRDFLIEKAGEPVSFIHLSGSKKLIADRMASRTGHFMPAHLLESQFATLELPEETEPAMSVDISGTLDALAQEIVDGLRSKNLIVDTAANTTQ